MLDQCVLQQGGTEIDTKPFDIKVKLHFHCSERNK